MDVDVSYLDSQNWIEEDMLERFAWLRANDPVRWSEADGLWLISKYEDVEYVSKHQELFTSAKGVRPTIPTNIGLIDEAEPRHGQLRKLLNKGFTPRMVAKLEETFRRLTKKSRTPSSSSITSAPDKAVAWKTTSRGGRNSLNAPRRCLPMNTPSERTLS